MKFKYLFLLMLLITPTFAAHWWDASWSYRRNITYANDGDVDAINYPTLLNVDTLAFVSTERFKADCSDLRILTESDEIKAVYIEDCNTTNTKIYIRVANVSAGQTENRTVYYGNPLAADLLDFNATFSNSIMINGGFEGDTVGNDPANWVVAEGGYGSIDVSQAISFEKNKSVLYHDNNTGGQPTITRSFSANSENFTFEFELYLTNDETDDAFIRVAGNTGDFAIGSLVIKQTETVTIYPNSAETDLNISAPLNIWNHFKMEYNWLSATTKYWINDAYAGEYNFRNLGGAPSSVNAVGFQAGTPSKVKYYIDAVRIYETTKLTVLFSGEEESGNVDIINVPLYVHANETINLTAVGLESDNITNSWWWIENDGGNLIHVSSDQLQYNFSNLGLHYVNVTAFVQNLGFNKTGEKNITVYADLTNISLIFETKLPFIFSEPKNLLNFSRIGGSPQLNETWIITTPNNTLITVEDAYVNFTLKQSGIHSVFLELCDTFDIHVECLNTTDTFKVWNVTGGFSLINSFNKTENLLAQVLLDDSITFSSNDNLNWTLNGTSTYGTSTSLTFENSNYYYSNDDYYHYNISLFNLWGNYNSSKWFTVIVGRYEASHNITCTKNNYCIINAQIYNELTGIKEIADVSYLGTLTLSETYGHENSFYINTEEINLNISLCINATPLISSLYLDGTIIYSIEVGEAQEEARTYAFENAEILLTPTCSNLNGKNFTFWGITADEASDITITVLRGGVSLEGALVKIQAYTGNWHTVASQLTDGNGQILLPLQNCQTFYKILVEQDGTQLYEEKICFKTTSHTINIDTTLQEFYELYQGIASFCAWNNNTNFLTCSVSDPSGLTIVSELKVYNILSQNVVCTTSESSSTVTLVCNLNSESDGDYVFSVKAKTVFKPDGYIINSGSFTKGTGETIASDGAFIALMFLLLVIFGARLSPVIMIVFSTFIFIFASVTKLIAVPYSAISWLLSIAIIVISLVIK